jgi:hypothetical protein
MPNRKYIDNKKNRGVSLIGILIIGLVVILVIGYFNISVKKVVESPGAQDNLHYVGDSTKSAWDKFLKEPVHYLWQDVWINIFWKGFISNMERIRDGKPTDFQTAAPKTK